MSNEKMATLRPPPSFPEKIMDLLQKEESPEEMWWLEGDKAFAVNTKKITPILDKYFQQVKLVSFTRKLNQWGFKRIPGRKFPPGVIAFEHPLFIKGQPELLKGVRYRKKGDGTSSNNQAVRGATIPETTIGVPACSIQERGREESLLSFQQVTSTRGVARPLAFPAASAGSASLGEQSHQGRGLEENNTAALVATAVKSALTMRIAERERVAERERAATALLEERMRQQQLLNSVAAATLELQRRPDPPIRRGNPVGERELLLGNNSHRQLLQPPGLRNLLEHRLAVERESALNRDALVQQLLDCDANIRNILGNQSGDQSTLTRQLQLRSLTDRAYWGNPK